MTNYFVIDKVELKITAVETLEEAALLAGTTADEIAESLRQFCRWDGENGEHAVILIEPDNKEDE
jgi:hypothetical protein